MASKKKLTPMTEMCDWNRAMALLEARIAIALQESDSEGWDRADTEVELGGNAFSVGAVEHLLFSLAREYRG
jgi:hypothetical protein